MITPDLVEELVTWLSDPYFLNCERNFGAVHEKTIKIGYDPFVVENEIILHTGKPMLRICYFNFSFKTPAVSGLEFSM